MVRAAMRRNPLHPNWYLGSVVIALYPLRRYDEALEANWKLGPNLDAWQIERIAACFAQLGRIEEAHKQSAKVLRLDPNFGIAKEMPNYMHQADVEHLAEGLRKAGLPP